ncbi:MAG: AAA family ATPase [Chloroflexota bacterium]
MPKLINTSAQTFRTLIEGNFVYIDKTRDIYNLVYPPQGIYFISRPRRFGKSVMISTLDELFRGNRELFKDLWIDSTDYDWQSYPIIRLDFSLNGVSTVKQLEDAIQGFLELIAKDYQVSLTGFNNQSRLVNLVHTLAEMHDGKVVLLIDEYDKPITDNLLNMNTAVAIRNTLRNFYGVVKGLDAYWRFVFITGISKFSKVGIFSMMNNLEDITMHPLYGTALGITEDELKETLHEYIERFASKEGVAFDTLLGNMRRMYDGFRFSANPERVYNPYSTMMALKQQRFANFWFSTGTPTFLINLLQEEDYDLQELDAVEIDDLTLSTYEIDNLEINPLLAQTGYITIKEEIDDEDDLFESFIYSYPNHEVRQAFVTHLLKAYSGRKKTLNNSHLRRLTRALRTHNLAEFFDTLNVFLAAIDYSLHLKYEKFYQVLFYMIFVLLGTRVESEIKTNIGRIDAVIELADRIYIFEFKIDNDAQTALQQTMDKQYYQKYRLRGKAITLVGANFDTSARGLVDWKKAEVDS